MNSGSEGAPGVLITAVFFMKGMENVRENIYAIFACFRENVFFIVGE